ncbi:putative tetratricopeptide-like helical domain superfamily [Helianthus annuus]|uniref:Putative pentatricopeptide repeat protein n=1 Tax=Helianthus annuus TaxID=4232 RepID=A0A251VF74_HELAN|nr:putative tetratricopeptide-like helical domain superfamily [Helianthus annuus]KAJ0776318.1 putative tetratricopeptide-like helical domain superfamily [Helianthus annuus]
MPELVVRALTAQTPSSLNSLLRHTHYLPHPSTTPYRSFTKCTTQNHIYLTNCYVNFPEAPNLKRPISLCQDEGKGYVIDSFSLPPLLKASTGISALSGGMELRGFASKMDFVSDPFVQTGLVAMYSACGYIEDARLMFDKRPKRDTVSWNIMIDGCGLFTHSYCVNGRYHNVLPLIEEMKRSNVQPDEKIFSTVVSACARARNLEVGKAFHEFITKNKVSIDYNMQCALVIMYAGCGSKDMAANMLKKLSPKNIVVSTAMITRYSKAGQIDAGRLIFDQMTEKELICLSAIISGYADGV